MKNSLIIFLFLTLSCVIKAQMKKFNKEECLNFYKGQFRNINENNLKVNSIIIRNGEKQLEVNDGIEEIKKIYWINDCNYNLYFTKAEAKKNSFKKFVNENGGIKVEVKNIENNILYYEASFFNGKTVEVENGRLIKLSNNAQF